MNLRPLEKKDAPGILSWMEDPEINRFFRFSKDKISLESVLSFIEDAKDTSRNLHLAVVDDADNYIGTVSLKEIDTDALNAEYAISLCPAAHGTGAAAFATKEILRIAFIELGLERVYLNVLDENKRANRFYQKFGFKYEGQFKKHLLVDGRLRDLNWYRMLREEFAE